MGVFDVWGKRLDDTQYASGVKAGLGILLSQALRQWRHATRCIV